MCSHETSHPPFAASSAQFSAQLFIATACSVPAQLVESFSPPGMFPFVNLVGGGKIKLGTFPDGCNWYQDLGGTLPMEDYFFGDW